MSHDSVAAAAEALKSYQRNSHINHQFSLEVHGASANCVTEKKIIASLAKNINIWASALDNLPCSLSLVQFHAQALIQVLPTAANLKLWNRVQDASYSLCARELPPTNKHVFFNCCSATALHRYTVIDILSILISWLKATCSISPSQTIYVYAAYDFTVPQFMHGIRLPTPV